MYNCLQTPKNYDTIKVLSFRGFFMNDDFQYAPRIVLNRYKRAEDGRIMPIEIYGSSSQQGTGIYVKPIHVLFDIGITFQKIDHIQDMIDYVIISHDHSDHLDWNSLKSLLNAHPMVNVLIPDIAKIPASMQHFAKHFIIVHDKTKLKLKLRTGSDILITPIKVPHGKQYSFSYSVSFSNASLLFSTDISNVKALPILNKFDLIMIETNYDRDQFISGNGSGGAINHLSVQDAIGYAQSHLTEYGKIIPLHFGPTMTNFNQLIN